MAESMCARMMTFVKREWWLIATVTAVAMTVAVVPAMRSEPSVTATARIAVDAASPGRVRGVLLPDDLVRESSTEQFRAAVAQEAGVAADEVAGALRVAASGSPITKVTVTCTMSSQDTAERVAQAAARTLIEAHLAAVASQIDMRERRVEIAQQALKDLASTGASATTAEAVFDRWNIEMALVDQQDALQALRNVYLYDGSVTSSITSVRSRAMRSAIGGLVLGFVAGAVLAVAREQFLASRAA
ncbi:hypothetical protein MX659_04140 [Coriobacteriia bacterium Es71-Z0120]|uniref:hypothetical protein n=1 Tax=Parvivirga hydrogeniphila TaxID=2939460 RepID=UPI0022608D57|nr:hypothetical protein [Parvivirga hydrogeniphila]MCL4078789.1 hypothetical protein [Parvivirga hydrogeniphila]